MKNNYSQLLICLSVATLGACKSDTTIRPTVKNVVEAVYASGKVIPGNDYKIFSLVDGTVQQRLVSEGDTIQSNQVLLTIENVTQQAQTSTAKEIYQLAEFNLTSQSPVLEELQSQLASLRMKLAEDSSYYQRLKNLWKENVGTKLELDKAKLRYELSKNDLQATVDRYERTHNQLKLDYQNAKNQLQINQQQGSYYDVKSGINGLVYELYKKPGELVRRYEALASVGNRDKFYIQLWVDEQDIEKIQVGQQLAISMDLHKGQTFEAKVTKKYAVLNEQNQSIRVDAEFTKAPSSLIANAIVEANIIVNKKDNAITVPKKYVVGDSIKIKNANGKPVYVHIKKGLENNEDVEILQGLIPASEIIVAK